MKMGCSIACCISSGCSSCPDRRRLKVDPCASPGESPWPSLARLVALIVIGTLSLGTLFVLTSAPASAQVESGVIRLAPSTRSEDPEETSADGRLDGIRRGFDYQSFTARLESLWFQRKALLTESERKRAARGGSEAS